MEELSHTAGKILVSIEVLNRQCFNQHTVITLLNKERTLV